MEKAQQQNSRRLKRCVRKCVSSIFLVLLCGPACRGPIFHQPGSEVEHIYSRIFLTDYNTAWQAALEALKRFEKMVQNRQGGLVQTAWIDNTAEKNFIDSFGGDVTYLKARYRLNLSISPGSYNGKPSVKVSILKDQMVQRDLLEGWKPVVSDSIEENTFLYRIGRIIYLKLRLKQLEEQKVQQVLDEGV